MRSIAAFASALLLSGLVACSDNYAEVKTADTIEAYEQYLTEHPKSSNALLAEMRLEELYLAKAEASGLLADFDAYLKRFPEGKLKGKVMEARKGALLVLADAENTPELWNQLLTEYSDTMDRKEKDKVKKRLRVAENKSRFSLTPIETEQVNLAEIADGPLDGWAFRTTVANTGDLPISHMVIRVEYLNEDGKAIDNREWPVVAKALPGNLPKPDGFDTPIPPGGTRAFAYADGNFPAGWSKKARLVVVDIRVDDPSKKAVEPEK